MTDREPDDPKEIRCNQEIRMLDFPLPITIGMFGGDMKKDDFVATVDVLVIASYYDFTRETEAYKKWSVDCLGEYDFDLDDNEFDLDELARVSTKYKLAILLNDKPHVYCGFFHSLKYARFLNETIIEDGPNKVADFLAWCQSKGVVRYYAWSN